jgi:hypothetical protein
MKFAAMAHRQLGARTLYLIAAAPDIFLERQRT